MVQAWLCVQKDKKSFFENVKDILKEGGIKALYKGVLPNWILVINPIINFVIYEYLRKKVVWGGRAPEFLKILLISSIAKSIATLVTYPILTCKTLAYVEKENKSVFKVIWDVYWD